MAAKEMAVVKPRLPPGFRFWPTDEELVVHYLRPRALACPLPAAVDIPDIRILEHDPSDLLPPGWSEPERYFFTRKEAKYANGRRANRATRAGYYWKVTSQQIPVVSSVAGGQSVLVGMKRFLVFYRGKHPGARKTEWVMHEYRLAGAGLAPCRLRGTPAEGWVLCRVFCKKGSVAAAASCGDDDDGGAEEEPDEDSEEKDGAPGFGFIDFFARAEAAQREQEEQEPLQRASSPVLSSSCLTDVSLVLQCCREQETTSSSRGA